MNIQVSCACIFLLLRNKDGNCVSTMIPSSQKYIIRSITLVTTSWRLNIQKKSLGFGTVSGPVIHWSPWVSLSGILSRNAACGNWEHKSWESFCGGDEMGIMKLAYVMRGVCLYVCFFLTRIPRDTRNNDPEDEGQLFMVNF